MSESSYKKIFFEKIFVVVVVVVVVAGKNKSRLRRPQRPKTSDGRPLGGYPEKDIICLSRAVVVVDVVVVGCNKRKASSNIFHDNIAFDSDKFPSH